MAREPFGSRLRSFRERAGLSPTQLGEMVGVSHGNIATWERTGAVPQFDIVERLAGILGVSSVVLLTGQTPGLYVPVNPRESAVAGVVLDG